MKKLLSLFLIGTVFFIILGFFQPIFAYEIQKLTNVQVENDFTLGPGTIEVFLDPGEKVTRSLLITNRLGKIMNFKVEIEDFEGSVTGEKSAILLGEKKGPYSLKDYLKPELTEFTLAHGERMVLPIEVLIPESMEPGGLYGSVLISTSPQEGIPEEEAVVKSQVRLIARIGSLFFVRVKGEADEDGILEKFDTTGSKRFYEKDLISFSIFYQNKGNVHLNPYGIIEIKNILGRKVAGIEIEPYFAMPKSLRYREVELKRGLWLGYYNATLYLNRGYDDIIDEAKISFWILPWKIILIFGIAIFFLFWLLWWFIIHFEIRKKS